MTRSADERRPGSAAAPRAESAVTVETAMFDSDGATPNNPTLPAVVLRGALPPGAGADAVRALVEANGWGGTWVWTVYPFHHHHDEAHEALAVVRGWADITLGGPQGRTVRAEAGDVLLLPAGTGHCLLADDGDFRVVGAYPPGMGQPAILRPDPARHDAEAERIAGLPLPPTDPVYGEDGPLARLWRRAAQ